MPNNPYRSCGFNPNRPLDEQLAEKAQQHRPGFSQSLHERIVQSIPWRDAEDLPAPADSDDLQFRQPTRTARLTYAMVAAAACLLAVVFVTQPVPTETTAVANPAPVAVADSVRDLPADPAPSADELAAVIEQTAAEVSSLARVATSEYWIDSAIEFQLAFDDRLQQLASVAEPD